MKQEQQFIAAANEGGIFFDGAIIANDQINRLHGIGHKAGSKNIAYRFNGIMGWIMDNKTGAFVKFSANGRTGFISAADLIAIEEMKQARLKGQAEIQQQVAQKARRIWKRAIYADTGNAYCLRKGISPHGTKTGDEGSLKGVLIIPLYNANNELVNLQFIQPDGTKRFLSGGQKKSCFFSIGDPTNTILIAEGFATGASLFEYFGQQTYIAFDAGNLEPVARIVKARYLNNKIIICGDNDESGKGQTAARATALSIGAKYMFPPTVGYDYNDYINAMLRARA